MEKILTSDQIKVMYRGNFTYKQAALYLGMSELQVKALVETGAIGANYINGIRISRVELDKYILANTRYAKPLQVTSKKIYDSLTNPGEEII